jgi:hypothetical protein
MRKRHPPSPVRKCRIPRSTAIALLGALSACASSIRVPQTTITGFSGDVASSPNQEWFASRGAEGGVVRADRGSLESGKGFVLVVDPSQLSNSTVVALAISNDGRWLASANEQAGTGRVSARAYFAEATGAQAYDLSCPGPDDAALNAVWLFGSTGMIYCYPTHSKAPGRYVTFRLTAGAAPQVGVTFADSDFDGPKIVYDSGFFVDAESAPLRFDFATNSRSLLGLRAGDRLKAVSADGQTWLALLRQGGTSTAKSWNVALMNPRGSLVVTALDESLDFFVHHTALSADAQRIALALHTGSDEEPNKVGDKYLTLNGLVTTHRVGYGEIRVYERRGSGAELVWTTGWREGGGSEGGLASAKIAGMGFLGHDLLLVNGSCVRDGKSSLALFSLRP